MPTLCRGIRQGQTPAANVIEPTRKRGSRSQASLNSNTRARRIRGQVQTRKSLGQAHKQAARGCYVFTARKGAPIQAGGGGGAGSSHERNSSVVEKLHHIYLNTTITHSAIDTYSRAPAKTNLVGRPTCLHKTHHELTGADYKQTKSCLRTEENKENRERQTSHTHDRLRCPIMNQPTEFVPVSSPRCQSIYWTTVPMCHT